MVQYYKLDKIIEEGTTYQAPADEFLVIRKIGTDATSATHLKIDGTDTGDIISTIAPLHKTSSNLFGPLDLRNLFYVVPPDKKFWIDGASGAKMRIIGEIGKLAPGEGLPAQFASRFTDQGKHYFTYISDSYEVGTDTTWASQVEYEVLSLTPKTTEKYILNHICGASITGDTVNAGDFGIRFYLEGKPLDILTRDLGKLGIDVLAMPLPPTATTEETPFSFEDRPIEVPGDITLSIRASNESGSDKAPASGSSWSITVTAVVEYIKQ